MQHVLDTLKALGYIDDATPMIEGERVHSGLTDLRVTDTGHVRAEGEPRRRPGTRGACYASFMQR